MSRGHVPDSGLVTQASQDTGIVGSIKVDAQLSATNIPPGKASLSISKGQNKDRSDIAILPLHIFSRNVRPPAITFKPPEPDARLNDTHQLAYCLEFLRSSYGPDDILDPTTRDWFQLTKADTDEQERLKALASDVIRAFKRDEFKDANAVAEVAYLAPVLTKNDFRYLVNEFYSVLRSTLT